MARPVLAATPEPAEAPVDDARADEREATPEPAATNGRRASKRERKPVKRLVNGACRLRANRFALEGTARGAPSFTCGSDGAAEGTKTGVRQRGVGDAVGDDELSEEEPVDDSDDDDGEHLPPAKRRKTRKAAAPRKRARKTAGAGSDDEAPIGLSEYNISSDNALFNAVRDPNAAVQTAVDDWVATYGEEEDDDTGPGVALAQLVNFLLRVRRLSRGPS